MEQLSMQRHSKRQTISHELICRKAQGDIRTSRHEALLAPGFEAEIQN